MAAIHRRRFLSAAALLTADRLKAQSHVHDDLVRDAEQAPLGMLFRGESPQACLAWQQNFAAQLRDLLGPHRPPPEWETVVERRVELDDHRRDELILRSPGHPDLPVYLLTPNSEAGRPGPAILALHGHGAHGYDALAGVADSEEAERGIREVNYDYGRQLVRRGYVVAIPCFTPFGRRLDDKEAYGGDDACAVTYVRMQLLGRVLMAENLRDALWSFELLQRNPRVDGARIGCVGLSYGGRMAMLAAALERRIRVAVVSGALNLMQERILHRYSCGAQVIPGLLRYGDVPEIGGLIAPRPVLWEIGSQDKLMVPEWIDPALQRLRRPYEALQAADQLQVDRFDGGHRWNGVHAYPLLDQVLKSSV